VAEVRTLVVTVAPLLAELAIGVLRPHMSLDVVAVLDARDRLEEHLRSRAPDLVIMGLAPGESDDCALSVLAALPFSEVLALDPSGKHAWLHEMRPHRTAMIDFSAAALVRALVERFDASSLPG